MVSCSATGARGVEERVFWHSYHGQICQVDGARCNTLQSSEVQKGTK